MGCRQDWFVYVCHSHLGSAKGAAKDVLCIAHLMQQSQMCYTLTYTRPLSEPISNQWWNIYRNYFSPLISYNDTAPTTARGDNYLFVRCRPHAEPQPMPHRMRWIWMPSARHVAHYNGNGYGCGWMCCGDCFGSIYDCPKCGPWWTDGLAKIPYGLQHRTRSLLHRILLADAFRIPWPLEYFALASL